MAILTTLFFTSFGVVVTALWLVPEHIAQLIHGRVITRALVLFLVVPSIVWLTIHGKVSGEAAIAALSSIAGYVLAATEAVP